MSGSLERDPLADLSFLSLFSCRVFSFVVMLTSLEVSQCSSRIFQLPFPHQGLQHAHNFESVSVSFA